MPDGLCLFTDLFYFRPFLTREVCFTMLLYIIHPGFLFKTTIVSLRLITTRPSHFLKHGLQGATTDGKLIETILVYRSCTVLLFKGYVVARELIGIHYYCRAALRSSVKYPISAITRSSTPCKGIHRLDVQPRSRPDMPCPR